MSDNIRYRNGPENEPWMLWKSALKLNYGNQQSIPNDFTRGERVSQTMQPDLMAKAGLRGFRFVPQIGHLNFLSSENLFGAYPELAGRGDAALGGRYCESATHQRRPRSLCCFVLKCAVSSVCSAQLRASAVSLLSPPPLLMTLLLRLMILLPDTCTRSRTQPRSDSSWRPAPLSGKETPFWRHFYIKCIISPRQARDKHRENSNKRVAFP